VTLDAHWHHGPPEKSQSRGEIEPRDRRVNLRARFQQHFRSAKWPVLRNAWYSPESGCAHPQHWTVHKRSDQFCHHCKKFATSWEVALVTKWPFFLVGRWLRSPIGFGAANWPGSTRPVQRWACSTSGGSDGRDGR